MDWEKDGDVVAADADVGRSIDRGVAITLAVSGASSGTETIEIFACGLTQSGPVLAGYDET